MDSHFETGHRVTVIASGQLAKHQRPEDLAKLIGKTGTVTGRGHGDLVEVRIPGATYTYEHLLHPSQLERIEDGPMPEGQLCDRLKSWAVHESYSATRGPRRGRCDRAAKAKDGDGIWACGIHLGADKRGEDNRKRGQRRRAWRDSAAGRSFLQANNEQGS